MVYRDNSATLSKEVIKGFSEKKEHSGLLKNNFLKFLSFFQRKEDVFYMRSAGLLFLLSKDSLLKHFEFIKSYVFDYLNRRSDWNCGVLSQECELYNEHKYSLNKGGLIYKYIARNGLINQSFVSEDRKGRLFIESRYLGCENYENETNGLIYADQPKRKVLHGMSVGDYLHGKNYEDRMLIYHNVYNYLFTQYAGSEYKKVRGEILDAHMDNIIINADGFHYIDKDIIYDGELDKSMVLYRQFGNSDEYKYFIKYYNLPDMSDVYDTWYPLKLRDTEAMRKARRLNDDLFSHYFSDKLFLSKNDFSESFVQKKHEIYLNEQKYIDPAWYEQQYHNFKEDVLYEWEKNAVQHYMKYGWKKGYNPSPDFDTNAYLKCYPNVKKENVNPLYHYVRYGQKEGRRIFKVDTKDK